MPTTVNEVMTKDVVKIDGDRTVFEASRIMSEKSVGSLIVVDGPRPIGIVTERDLVSRVLAEPFDPRRVLVRDIMTTPVFSITPESTLREAAETMIQYRVRRLPVIASSVLVGIITASDLAKALAAEQRGDPVASAIARQIPGSGPYG